MVTQNKFLHTVAIQDQSVAADIVLSFDLAVNPLSVVMVCIRPLNETATLTNFAAYFKIAQALNRCSILYRGESIVSVRGEDLAAMNFFRHGILPWQGQHNITDNERRCAVLPILMGKHAYDHQSCFPATRRGELVLELDIDVADTGYDGMRISVETIELLDAKPKEYEKKVQLTQTWVATGDQDFDLPPGNMNRGLLLFGTTGMTGATPAPSWGRMKVLLDNVETHYGNTDFEAAQMLYSLWGRQPPWDDHAHTFDGSAAGLSATTTTHNQGKEWKQYAFLDFDPTRDDYYTLDTRNKSRFHLRANAETADAVRVVPVEVIRV